MNGRAGSVFVVFLLVAVVFSGAQAVGGSSHADIQVSGSMETEPRSVTVDGQSFEVDALAAVQPGDEFTADVTGPSGSWYLDLYNSDRQIEQDQRGSGSETVTFQTGNIDPGTYTLALYVDSSGEYEAIHPIVIEAYDVQMNAPAQVGLEEDAEIEVTVTEIEPTDAPDEVRVVTRSEDGTEQFTASDDGGGAYSVTIDATELTEGEYEVYATAHGSDEFEGQPEILGVSEQSSLAVSSDGSGGDDGAGGNGPGGADPTETPETETPTETPTETQTPTETPAETPSNQTETPVESTPTTETPTSTTETPAVTTPSETPAETDDGSVITPSFSDDEPAESTDWTMSIVLWLLVMVAMVVVYAAVRSE